MTEEGLEKIVPSLDLCKLIPAGKFADSALVWRDRKGNISRDSFVKVREPEDISYANEFAEVRYYPAPTLAEIMGELPTIITEDDRRLYLVLFDARNRKDGWEIGYANKCSQTKHAKIRCDSLVDAALKLWLKLKGIEVKK